MSVCVLCCAVAVFWVLGFCVVFFCGVLHAGLELGCLVG